VELKKCAKCGEYVLASCPCGGKAMKAAPPAWSEDDKYWRERLKARGVKI